MHIMKTKNVLYIVSNIFSPLYCTHVFTPVLRFSPLYYPYAYILPITPRFHPFPTLHFTTLPFTSLQFFTLLDDKDKCS